MAPDSTLLFVYNADSDLFSTVSDYMHKIISPETYTCSLCKLTHTNIGMRNEWASYLKGLPFFKEFLHKDEFIRKYNSMISSFPTIYLKYNTELELLASSKEINGCSTLDDLKKLLEAKLALV